MPIDAQKTEQGKAILRVEYLTVWDKWPTSLHNLPSAKTPPREDAAWQVSQNVGGSAEKTSGGRLNRGPKDVTTLRRPGNCPTGLVAC